MNRKIAKTFALGSYAMVVVLGVWSHAQAQDAKTPYPSMAPLDQYLMERNAEIALARSAAPQAISRDAEVLVLGGMAMKPRSKARMVSYALWSEGGCPHSMVMVLLVFGTLNSEARSASIRRLPAPSCR